MSFWSIAFGERKPQDYPVTEAGLAEALDHAGSDGYVVGHPGTEDVSIPAIAQGVRLRIIADMRSRDYVTGGELNRARLKVREFGAVGDGVTDDYAAIMLAHDALPSTGGTIDLEDLQCLHGTPISFSKRVRLLGDGSDVLYNGTPTCKLIKSAGISATGITFTINRSGMEGVAYIGAAGNGGDGVNLRSNSCFVVRSMIAKMGGNGLNLGRTGAISNVNKWYIDDVGLSNNGQDGLYIYATDINDDANANAGTAVRLNANLNTRNGVRIESGSKNTFVGLLTESNTEEGVYLLGASHANTFVGGDNEGNFLTDLPTPTQIRISDELGVGFVPGDSMFINVGINTGYRIVDEGLGTCIWGIGYEFRYPRPDSDVGRFSSNARPDGSGGSALSTHPNGVFHSMFTNEGERIRWGITPNTGILTGILPAQVVHDHSLEQCLWLASRSNAGTGKVRMAAGSTLTATAEINDIAGQGFTPNGGFLINRGLSIQGTNASAYNGTHVIMGTYHLWVDSSGRLRIKSSAPSSDTDGDVVGTQS